MCRRDFTDEEAEKIFKIGSRCDCDDCDKVQ